MLSDERHRPRLWRRARAARARRRAQRDDPAFARLFARFALTGLAAMIVIGVIAFVDVRRSAASNALRQARSLTQLAGRGIAQPLMTPGVLRGRRRDLARLDRAVRSRILHGSQIVRVKIWDAAGRIVYSDEPRLIGSAFPLGSDELHVLRDGGVESDASDLRRPENRYDRGFRRLVEVYVGIRATDGTRLLYEDYERSSALSASSRRQWLERLPALVGALLVLYLVQLPLAYSLGRRARDRQRERAELLRRAIEASDLERRRIAADLHDSAVQRLAGVSLSLAAATAHGGSGENGHGLRATVATAAAETRETIRELRTLLVDIYPPTLQRSGLLAALDDLVAPLRNAGADVVVRVPGLLDLPDDIEALFYRVAQEAVRNIRQHGHASEVEICVQTEHRQAVLAVEDNGRGFAASATAENGADRHFGLRLMRDLADHAGGHLAVTTAPGEGTAIRVTVPTR